MKENLDQHKLQSPVGILENCFGSFAYTGIPKIIISVPRWCNAVENHRTCEGDFMSHEGAKVLLGASLKRRSPSHGSPNSNELIGGSRCCISPSVAGHLWMNRAVWLEQSYCQRHDGEEHLVARAVTRNFNNPGARFSLGHSTFRKPNSMSSLIDFQYAGARETVVHQ